MATPNIVPRINGEGGIGTAVKGWGKLFITNTTASSATEGGKIVLAADDGAVMGDNHRLGVLEFKAAEDGSNTLSIGARIQSVARDAWDGSNNDADLEFYTTNGTTESKVLTLNADKQAIVEGPVTGTNYRTIYIDAGSMVPSVTNGAQAGTEETATSTAMNDYYAFDTATDEHVWFKMVMPAQYDGGTVKFKAYWRPKSSTTTSHDVTWSFLSIAHDDGDDIETALSASNIVEINDSVLGTADTKLHITAATPAHTIAGVSAGANDQLVWFRVTRDISSDDLNEDAYLFGVAIQYKESNTPDVIWT